MSSILTYLKDHILVFDGAMGTMIQRYKLSREDFQGFECNDYLSVVKPEIIKDIHRQYL
ncbi:MAG: homocysteine S-methyltransferase family protein, partial [Candidatus Cloacimonetes bacterium]|nr:homocysteine S-methyltransferase family protein [Candidatus Cloacimonadota bacterium]